MTANVAFAQLPLEQRSMSMTLAAPRRFTISRVFPCILHEIIFDLSRMPGCLAGPMKCSAATNVGVSWTGLAGVWSLHLDSEQSR